MNKIVPGLLTLKLSSLKFKVMATMMMQYVIIITRIPIFTAYRGSENLKELLAPSKCNSIR